MARTASAYPGVRHVSSRRALFFVIALFLASVAIAQAQAPGGKPGVVETLVRWTPLLFHGFLFNLAISVLSMAIGTGAGIALGILQISRAQPVSVSAYWFMQVFRNAPWLVLMFFVMFLTPFEFRTPLGTVPFPDWMKAVIGLALPVMANVSEIVRGGIVSLPFTQWEAAHSLGFDHVQTLRLIILPQAVKRMLPPWMNLYAILTQSTTLASILGVTEVLTITRNILGSEGRTELLMPFYGYILVWFFLYCFPIAAYTKRLERRFAVAS
ncbi:MAG: amino acid ABC transporter permease [Candidatus Eremiobacteraeota bacterium]|nr:amino acid ABC transporter permease [Candidatus Eremiobacteraeota bacterium]